MRGRLRRGAALVAGLFLAPAPAFGWGASAQRVITGKAVETLPADVRSFFEANRNTLVGQSTEPIAMLGKNPVGERSNHFIYLDRYGRFPYDEVPRDYKAALTRRGRRLLEANGRLPWQIGYYSEQLTNAFKAHNWDEVRRMAALLAYYVAAAHDPFNTTENFDGRLSKQSGVNRRFTVNLVDRFAQFFFLRPNEAVQVHDPTDRAFEMCLDAHSWIEHVLLADRRARRGLPDYTDEYFDRFYSQAGAVLIRKMSDAATDVGSYWLSAWIHAGRPALPPR